MNVSYTDLAILNVLVLTDCRKQVASGELYLFTTMAGWVLGVSLLVVQEELVEKSKRANREWKPAGSPKNLLVLMFSIEKKLLQSCEGL